MNCNSPYVVVIGGSNMDIAGNPTDHISLGDSAPGTIRFSSGGVGRNIADNLMALDINTYLLSSVGQDPNGNYLIQELSQKGFDISTLQQVPNLPTSTYMSVQDEQGNMQMAIADMRITKTIDQVYLKQHHQLILEAEFVVIDTNMEPEVYDFLFSTYLNTKFIVDTVSIAKSIRIKPYLPKIYGIKPNLLEAGKLLEMDLSFDTTDYLIQNQLINEALKQFQQLGVHYPMISLGEKGIAYLKDNQLAVQKKTAQQVLNVTGAGDSFIAGFTYGLIKQQSFERSIELGINASLYTIECSETVNSTLTTQLIESRL